MYEVNKNMVPTSQLVLIDFNETFWGQFVIKKLYSDLTNLIQINSFTRLVFCYFSCFNPQF